MNKEKFKNVFNHEYPYSCMTVADLRNIIEAWPKDEMPFCIEGSWSWRGIYADPCLYISTKLASKKENLKELQYVLEYEYEGWKGGSFYYNESSLLHFETSEGNCTTAYNDQNCWFVDFLEQNENNPFIQSIYEYFENNHNLKVVYHEDFLGKDLKLGNQVVYYSTDGFRKGYIKDIDKENKMVLITEKPYTTDEKTYYKPYNQIIQINGL